MGNASLDPLEENKRIVRKFFEYLTSGRMEDVISLFAPDGVFWGVPARKSMSTSELLTVLNWVKGRLVGDMRMEIVRPMIAENNSVSVCTESFADLIDGRPYNNVYNFFFEIEHGKIKEAREYNDSCHVLATLMDDESGRTVASARDNSVQSAIETNV
jgi:ketosteroid isomerase-like protein